MYRDIGTEKLNEIKTAFEAATEEFLSVLNLPEDAVCVLGCSTSEIAGASIGQDSIPALGETIVRILLDKLKDKKSYLAVQCCEHLNRALVIEKSVAVKYNCEIVSAVPKEKAGGSVAAAAYKIFNEPVLAEFIRADVGIDIGDTFIGMHLKHVAVPIRLSINKIGSAHITFAKTRPKYIGGERTQYI